MFHRLICCMFFSLFAGDFLNSSSSFGEVWRQTVKT